ncbi:hypothetical protein HELRODRAFT_194469 [Helobdella robusta]|uniref:STAS domain-containing protein n=1 Tax=Helobdella robusta TaxID=6412 RepID=T1FW33_HELRO|nr:hypothetical protein HELRODRAFT_194469 [Helobdella robusta]ESN91991.1 hypothetical protein HELRODRAFT_194469 [Helobdella robusta]
MSIKIENIGIVELENDVTATGKSGADVVTGSRDGRNNREKSIDIVIERDALSESELEIREKFERRDEGDDGADNSRGCRCFKSKLCQKRCKFSKSCLWRHFVSSFPVIGNMRGYKWRQWLLNDVMAGVSVGFIHLPQGLAFSLLAGVPAVLGLYSSIIPAWLYFIFGTSQHNSVGTMAVMALMVGSYVNKFEYDVTGDVTSRLDMSNFSNRSSDGVWANDTISKIHSEIIGGVRSEINASKNNTNNIGNINNSLIYINNNNDSTSNDDNNNNIIIIANNNNNNISNSVENEQRMNAATLITLTVGCLQLLMWMGRLGVMSSYMSRPFVKSFIAGAAVHIIINQLPLQFGYPVKRTSGSFQLPINFYRILSSITETNVASLLTSIICMSFLLSLKFFCTRKVANKLKFPIPGELIVVLVGTMVSYLAAFEARFHLKIIGAIPGGLPKPHLPSLSLLPSTELEKTTTLILIADLVRQAIPIAIVCYALNITMAKLMSDKHDYPVDPNQEILAIGIVNTVSPFFGCFVSSQAPPRTLVIDSSEGKSSLASLISTLIPVLVISGTGFLFTTLPICVLGSVVSASLMPLLVTECIEFSGLWRVCRRDYVVWVFCFVSTVLLNVDIGLIVGIIGSGFAILLETRHGRLMSMRNVANTELFVEDVHYGSSSFGTTSSRCNNLKNKDETNKSTNNQNEKKQNNKLDNNDDNKKIDLQHGRQQSDGHLSTKNIAVFRSHGSIIFSNADLFKEQLLKSIQVRFSVEPNNSTKRGTSNQSRKLLTTTTTTTTQPPSSSSLSSSSSSLPPTFADTRSRKFAILDFSRVSDIDTTGLNVMKDCFKKVNSMGVDLCLCCCSGKVKRKLKAGGLFSGQDPSQLLICPSLIDAMVKASKKLRDEDEDEDEVFKK